uniref:Patched family protein n=1 Tax=Heterorhabditis bacteriophora TaxID=37862 RepID=A0A1I7XPJ4_HETBA
MREDAFPQAYSASEPNRSLSIPYRFTAVAVSIRGGSARKLDCCPIFQWPALRPLYTESYHYRQIHVVRPLSPSTVLKEPIYRHSTSIMLCKKFFEHWLAELFTGLGRFIGRRPSLVLFLSLITTGLFSIGFIWFEEVNNVRTEYSPMDSPSRIEYAVAKAFLNQNGTLDPSYIMVLAADGGSLLRDSHRMRLIELTKTLQNNVTTDFKGKTYEFRDLCEPYCELNTAFLAFLKLYDSENPATFSYPQVEIFGTQAFIDYHASYALSLII